MVSILCHGLAIWVTRCVCTVSLERVLSHNRMTELEVKAVGTLRSHAVECWTQPGSTDLLRGQTHDKIKWTEGTGDQVHAQQFYQSTAPMSPCGPQAQFQDSQKFF